MGRRGGWWRTGGPWIVLFVIAVGSASLLVRPWIAGQVGYDSAASVLFFDRIASGQRLEAFITVTPKPLLTMVYGAIYASTHDWRVISAAALLIYGADCVLAARLAQRLAGPLAAGFAAIGILGSAALLEDASAAYAIGPALLGWLVAALAVTRSRPRYGIAGLSLMLAGLARFETLILVGSIAVILAALQIAGAWRPGIRPPPGAWLLLIGFGAIPVQIAHDWLLTGDPLWSQAVPAIASAGADVRDPGELLRWFIGHFAAMGPLVLLGAFGVLGLWRARQWPILVGMGALGPGLLVFLMILAARGVYVSNRYITPADVTVLLAAAIGAGMVRVPPVSVIGRGVAARWPVARPAIPVLAGCLAALFFVVPFGPLDAELRIKVRANLAMFENVDAAHPATAAALDRIPGVRDLPPDPDPRGGADDPTVLVPVLLRPRLAVELDLPLTAIVGTDAGSIRTDGSYPAPGQIVHHDPRGDLPPEGFALFEVSQPTTIDAIRLVPLLADPDRRVWVQEVQTP